MLVNLYVDVEEVVIFFGVMFYFIQNVENFIFQKNFFKDFRDVFKEIGGVKDQNGKFVDIKEFVKFDFIKIFEYYKGFSEVKKVCLVVEKKVEKVEKDKFEVFYMYCKWDGWKEKVGNFCVELFGFFCGCGEYFKIGIVKKCVMFE